MRKLAASLGALSAVLLGGSATAAACDAAKPVTTASGWTYHGSEVGSGGRGGEIILAGNSSSNSSSNSNSNSSSNSNSNSSSNSSSNSNSNSSSNSNSNSSDDDD